MNPLSLPENPIFNGEVTPLDAPIPQDDRIVSHAKPVPISVTPIDTEPCSTTDTDKVLDRSTPVTPTDAIYLGERNVSSLLPSASRAQPSLAIPNFPDFPDLPDFPGLPDIPIILPPFQPELSGKYFNVIQEPLTFGDSFDLDFEIQNTGLANAGGFWADFYLSADSNISNAPGSSDVLLGYQWISGLAAGATTGVLSKNLTLPNSINSFWDSIGNGTYYVGVISDALKNVSESNESNNSSTGWFVDYDDVYMSAPPGVDLLGQSFNIIEEPLNAGDTFNIDFEVKNTGSDAATGFWADFYLSADSDISNASGSGDVLLGYEWIPSLAGASTTGVLSKNLELPDLSDPIWDSIGSGTYYVGMISDALGNVTETNEINNDSTGFLVDYDDVFVSASFLTANLDFTANDRHSKMFDFGLLNSDCSCLV